MTCLTCRDLGLPEGCPSCGKTSVFNEPETIPVTEKKMDFVCIPEYYRDQKWSKETLLDTHKDAVSQVLLEKYAETLDRIYNIFRSGAIPNKSFFVIAQRGMAKMTWAYSCMYEALRHKHTVMPIIDNTQFKRLNIISSDRISSKFLKDIDYTIEQYLSADVVFLTVDPDNFQSSYRTIDSLLSKRARLGLPTFVLSRFSVAQMSLLDYDNSFASIVSRQQQDRNKYVVIIGGQNGR